MGVFGGYLVGVRLIGVDEGSFWSQMQAAVDFRQDILNGIIKSFVFGVAVTWIAVSRATTPRRPPRAFRGRPRGRRDLVARDTRARFRTDRIDVQRTVEP